jgi:hypothetical protein
VHLPLNLFFLAINLSNSNKKTAPKLAKGEMSTAD